MKVYEIAILGRVTWDLHSLNNEGTVGNVTEPRTLVLADGTKTDGVSGEMLKHIHAGYVWKLENDKSKFCDVCRNFWPEKADSSVKGKKNAQEVVQTALSCELCDVHGFLVQRPATSRESTIEFGWAVGIPQIRRTIHVHSRHALHEASLAVEEQRDRGEWENEKCSDKECNTSPDESKLYKMRGKWYCEEHVPEPPERPPQMIYHRPTRSGTYGIVSVFQPWRIGLNNVNFNYDVGDDERKHRYELVLKAYQAMFMRPEGAMTSTRLPHTEGFEGLIVVSNSNLPVPVISPLKDNYVNQVEEIIKNLDRNDVDVKKFKDLSEFVKEMKSLLGEVPYKVIFTGEKKQNPS